MSTRGCEVNPVKIQGPSTSVKFLGVHGEEHVEQDITYKMKDNLLDMTPPTTKKETQSLLCLFGFCRQHISHLGVLFQPIWQVTQKAASFG